MDEDLPNEFDLVVVGTGFSESIVAAAASRIGKTVLHVDPNEYYGGSWASFNLEALEAFAASADNEKSSKPIQNIKVTWNLHAQQSSVPGNGEGDNQNDENEWTKEKVLKKSRGFNIDLMPKLLFSCGKLVKLLISSNICRYAEFRAIDHVCTIVNGHTKSVPCSRTDVFNTKDLNVVEKRLLMKLLTSCMSYDEHPEEFHDFENRTFLEYLRSLKLTENIIHCVLYAISMSDERTMLKVGIENTKRFLNSLGRYGNTPFIFPMYGCGEIPQCFCRLCAVFGGIYCLKRAIETANVENDSVTTIKCVQKEIKVKHIVLGHGNRLPNNSSKSNVANGNDSSETLKNCGKIARGIFITTSPLGDAALNSGGGGVNFLKLTNDSDAGAYVIQLSHYSGTCPKGLYLIHITCESKTGDSEADLNPYLDKLLQTDQPPTIIYSVYFTISGCSQCCSETESGSSLSNVFDCCGPFLELDYDRSIENAEAIFRKIYPEEEFLPRAPDPEEIIIGDEDPVAVADDAISLENIKDQIMELEAGLQNEEDCIEENSRNEEKVIELSEEE